MRRLVNVVYWTALVLWVSALVSAGIAAMNVFGTLVDAPIAWERYAAYPGAEHGRLAAGHVMEGVFFTVDLVQFAAIPLVLLTLGAQLMGLRMPLRRPANLLRCACLVTAAGLFAYHALALAPRMNRELRAHWTAAEAGDVAAATAHRTQFNALHPVADTLLRANLVLTLIAVAASAAAFTRTAAPTRPEPGELEPPRLAS